MHNVSAANYTHFSAQTGRTRGGLGQPGARAAVLQTVTALSFLGPRRVAPGGRRKHATGEQGGLPQTAPVARQVRSKKHAGVRVRETAASAQRATTDAGYDTELRERRSAPLSRKKRKKADRAQQLRQAGARSGSVPSAGSRRQPRRAGALDDLVVAPGSRGHAARQETDAHASQRTRRSASCTGAPIPLGRDNFTRIKDDLDGCYRLVEDALVDGHQIWSLPIGNSTDPFTGTLDSAEYSLIAKLQRSKGDLLLFGAIRDSMITLAVRNSYLHTYNGSRSALVGEMQEGNRLHITRFDRNWFWARGEGTVEVGLVVSTSGAHNEILLNNTVHSQLGATAVPPSVFCSPPCSHRAVVSLGLGTIMSAGDQSIVQNDMAHNRLSARAISYWPWDLTMGSTMGQRGGNSSGQACVGALGVLGDPRGAQARISSVQRGLHDNLMKTVADGIGSTAEDFAVAGYACSSLGYGDLGCSPAEPALSPAAWLWAAQLDCYDNWVLGSSRNKSVNAVDTHHRIQGGGYPGGVARVSLVSNAAVGTLLVEHRGVGRNALETLAHAGGQENALLGPAQEARVRLYSGGAAGVPLFARWSGTTHCLASSLIDRAGYQLGNLNCLRQNVSARQPDPMALNSLEPDDWRQLYDSLGFSNFSNFSNFSLVSAELASASLPCASDGGLHYPHEAVQSLLAAGDEWLLVTRQRYPFRQENDLKGLLRVRRFQLPDSSGSVLALSDSQPTAGLLYQAPAGTVPAGELPVQALMQDLQLHLLYQGPGQPAQVVSLSLKGSNATGVINQHYQLAQYDGLAGQARLLSVEDEGLYLWMQHNDSLQAVSLANPGDSSRRLLFDLSGQPGGQARLAWDGRWLYSLRQAEGQPASLRRFKPGAAGIDPHLQAVWEGTLPQASRLSLGSNGRLSLVPVDTLRRSRTSDLGLQVKGPEVGGCLQWKYIILPNQGLSATAGTRSSDVHATPTSGDDGSDDAPLSADAVFLLASCLSSAFGAVGGVLGVGVAAYFIVRCWRRRRIQAEWHDLRPLGRLMVMSRNELQMEIPAREQAVVEEAQGPVEVDETSL